MRSLNVAFSDSYFYFTVLKMQPIWRRRRSRRPLLTPWLPLLVPHPDSTVCLPPPPSPLAPPVSPLTPGSTICLAIPVTVLALMEGPFM